MHLKLKEDPREWRKFVLQFCGLMLLLTGWLAWQGLIGAGRWPFPVGFFVGLGLVAGVRPRWFRGFYRWSMQASAWLGDRMGRVILTGFFFLIMLPLGWILRLAGHDPLALRRRVPARTSYWQPAGKSGRLDRMY